jgi:hypothetical protein
MKKTNGKRVVPPLGEQLKRTSRAAEAELAHLEEVIRGVLRSDTQDLPMGPQYWRARFDHFERGYALLPVQQKRVEALEKMIAEIEA